MQINRRGNKGSFNYQEENYSTVPGREISQTETRTQIKMKETTESGYGEMIYLDPSDVSYRRNQVMSPIVTEGRQSQMGMRSPPGRVGQSIISAVRQDMNERRPLPNISGKFESSRERLERSPKNINIGDTEREIVYNMRTLNSIKSPKTNNMNKYGYNSDNGNMFLDQPMQSVTFIKEPNDNYIPSPSHEIQNKGNEYIVGNSREIQYTMNPRDLKEPLPNLMGRMSPKRNVDDQNFGNSDNLKASDGATQLKDLKTQIGRNVQMIQNEDGMNEQPRQIQITAEKSRDHMTEGEIKKMVKKIEKGYDRGIQSGNRLISMTQTIIPSMNDEIFNDRYKVLQKMNKLSTILLAKNRNTIGDPTINTRTFETLDKQKKTFDRNTLNSTIVNKGKGKLNRSPQNRFLYLSLAMISSKGPNCEDRIILRKMRFDKGGVVDLAQDSSKKKAKYQVRKVQRKAMGGKGNFNTYNPKYREKAAKVVQGWWRDLKDRYKRVFDKIVRIQSAWRGRWLRKYIYDIIYLSFLHQRFCDILERIMVSNVRPKVWDQLFARRKWARNLLSGVLTRKDRKFSTIRIRPYFEKFKQITSYLKARNLRSKNLLGKKEGEMEKLKDKKLIKKYFDDWLLRTHLLKYIEKNKDEVKQKKKFFAALKIVNGTNTLAQRSGLSASKDKLKDYLFRKNRERVMRKIILNDPKYQNIPKRRYFTKWNRQLARFHLKDFKDKIFGQMLNRLDGQMDKIKLKEVFSSWRSKLPRDKYLNYQNGANILQRFCFRKTHKDPLTAITIKSDYKNEKEGIMRMLGVKSRYIKQHWRDYLFKWRSHSQKAKDKQIQNEFYKTLLTTMLNKRRYRIMANRFNQWRKQPKLDLDALFDRYKAMNNMIRKTWNNNLKSDKQKFFDKLKKTVHQKSYKKAGLKIMEKYFMKDRVLSRYFLYKWKNQCKDMEIYDLKLQLIKYLYGANDKRNRKNNLAKMFSKWKVHVNTEQMKDKAERLKIISDGLSRIKKMYNNRQIEFMIRLFRLMNNDYRPKFILSISRRLMKPRSTIRECFNRWKRVREVKSNDEKVKDLKGKLLKTNAKRYNERVNRDAISRAFFQWRAHCRNAENYYPNITQGIKKLSSGIIKKYLKENFKKLGKSKNYARRLIPVLKNNKYLMERLKKDIIRDKFNKWKSGALKTNIKDLKSNIIFKTKNNMDLKNKAQILSKYFTKWKVYRPKKLDYNFYKAIMLIQNFCQKPYRKKVFEAFMKKLSTQQKTKGTNELFGTIKKLYINRMRNYLINLFKKTALIDPKRGEKIKIKLRKKVKELSQNPLEKAFHRWLRALIKNPNFQKYNESTKTLKTLFIRHNGPNFLNKLKNKVSPNFVSNRIIKNILPYSKLAKNRVLRNYFDKWKSKKNKLEVRDLKGNLLSKLYSNGKNLVRERFLRKYFKRWSYKEPERKPLDLFGVLQAWDKVHKVFSNKYMQGFYKKMEQYGRKKFLKSLVSKCTMYNKRAMKPYFDKWRSKAIKLSTKIHSQATSSRFMNYTTSYRTNAKLESLLRSKFNQWKKNIQKLKDLRNKNFPLGFKKLENFVRRTSYPDVLFAMKVTDLKRRKDKAISSLPSKRKKSENFHLKKTYDKWKNKITKLIMKEMSNRLKYNQLRHLVKRVESGTLKYFLLWKFKSGVNRSASPYQQAIDKIRKLFIRDQVKKFTRRADMMNLKVPRGISTQSALIRKKRNLAKSIALRNVSLRPFWNKWIKKAKAIKNKANIHRIFGKTLTPALKNIDKLQMRRWLNKWKDKVNSSIAKGKLKEARGKLLYMIYGYNEKFVLKHYFVQWMKKCDSTKKRLATIEEGLKKLKQHAGKNFTSQMRKLLKRQNKFQRIKAIFSSKLRQNDKDNLAKSMSKWRLLSNKSLFLQLKGIVLKNLSQKTDYKNAESIKDRLHEVFLHWRIRCAPQDYLERIKKIREGWKFLRKGVRNPLSRKVFVGIKERAKEKYRGSLITKFVNVIGPKSNYLNKLRAFNTWKSKLGDTNRMKKKILNLFKDYLISDTIHEKLFHESEKQIVDMMKAYHAFRTKNSKSISSFCRGILNIKRNLNRLKKSKFLFKTLNKLNNTLHHKAKISLSNWLRNAKISGANSNAKLIQQYLKSRLNNPSDKRKRINRGGEFLDKYVKKKVFITLAKQSKDNKKKKGLLHHINNQEQKNRKELVNIFNKWKNLIPVMKKHDAAAKIQNNYRNMKAIEKVKNIKKRNERINAIVGKLAMKYNKYESSNLRKWNNQIQREKVKENANTIQSYITQKVKEKKKVKAKNKIKDLVKKNIMLQLKLYIEKASRILGDKGEVMGRTLEDIYIRRPFNKIINRMKSINKTKKLKKVMPQIKEALRNYWLPFYMNKWRKNTWEDKVNKTIRIQNWIKGKLILLRKRKELRKEQLLSRYLNKLTKDKELKLTIPFKLWGKITLFDKLNNAAINIQKIWKGGMSKKRAGKLVSQVKLKNIFKNNILRKIAETLEESSNYVNPLKKALEHLSGQEETRYATNNIIDFSNDALRNLYLLKITGNKAYTDGLSAKRRYFNKWNQYNRISNDQAKKIQTAFRAMKGRYKRQTLERLKENLYNIILRCSFDKTEQKRAVLRKWLSTARFLKCDDMSRIIGQFLRPRMAKLLNKKFKDFFINTGNNIIKLRLNQGAKVNKLKNEITKPQYIKFFQRLRNKNKYEKLKNLFIKNFSHFDDQFKKLLIEKYFQQWAKQTDKVKGKREDSALKIQNLFKSYLQRKKVNNLKKRNNILTQTVLKLSNDRDLQKQVGFNVWRSKVNNMKINDSSIQIQKFLDEIKEKLNKRKKLKKNRQLKKGLIILMENKIWIKEPFEKIKSESNRKIFSKFNNILTEKRKNQLKSAFDAIKQNEKGILMNRLFKVPISMQNRIFKKTINTWLANAKKISRKHAAELIQRNYKLLNKRKLNTRINELINERLKNLAEKNFNSLHSYFNRWKKNVKKSKLLNAGNKINLFLEMKFKTAKARNRWNEFTNLLNRKKNNDQLVQVLMRIREYLALQKIAHPIEKELKHDGLQAITKMYKLIRLKDYLRDLFTTVNEKNSEYQLKTAFERWKNKVSKFKVRDNFLNGALGAIDKRRKIIATKTINQVSLVKKLFNTIPKIRALNFFDRLRQIKKEKKVFEDIGNIMKQSKFHLKDDRKKIFIQKIYKLFIYQKLNNFCNIVQNHMDNKVKKKEGSIFFNKLFDNIKKNSYFNYNGEKRSTFQTPVLTLKFSKKVINPRNRPILEDSNSQIKKVLPFFVQYLNKKIKAQKKQVMDKLIDNDRDGRFCSLFKRFGARTMVPHKEELVDELKTRTEYMDTRGNYLIGLFTLMRRKYVKHITTSLVEPSRIYKLLYLLKLTYMHKKIAKQRFVRELSRKWRFAVFSKKMARKKLEIMYRNLHVSYLQMANEVFGDDDVNPSVMKEFERFGNNIGMFSSEESSINDGLSKKYVKTVQKKYVFKKDVIEEEAKQYSGSGKKKGKIERVEVKEMKEREGDKENDDDIIEQ